MTLRRLLPADAAPYRALMLEAYSRHPDAFTSAAEERAALPAGWWSARLAAGDDAAEIVHGAWDGDALVGVAGIAFETRAKLRHKARLFGMYVVAPQRGRGLGDRLVRAALSTAAARPGVTLVQLSVTDGNHAAQVLYARHGFVVYGLEPRAVAVDGGQVAKAHMWCDLEARVDPTGLRAAAP